MLDIGFKRWRKERAAEPLDDSSFSSLLNGFDSHVPFQSRAPLTLLQRTKSFFKSPLKTLFVILFLSLILLVFLLVPLIVSVLNQSPQTLRNGTFILATFHSVLGVVVITPGILATRPLVQFGSEPRGLLLLPDGGLLFAQSQSIQSRVWKLKNACSGHDPSVFSSSNADLAHPYGKKMHFCFLAFFLLKKRNKQKAWLTDGLVLCTCQIKTGTQSQF
jgi:hypothetical protein